jgi:AcrR family transcriptional regulator
MTHHFGMRSNSSRAGARSTETAEPASLEPPKRGRPAKLSSELIVRTALAQLAEVPLDGVTFVSVAKALRVTTMSLYSYFPQRDALLEAMTDRAFAQLQLPDRGGPWREYLLGWLWAVERHFERYPEVSKTIGWSGKVPAAWLRVSVPVIDVLRAQGLQGVPLVIAVHWFMSSAVGLLITETVAPAYRHSASLAAAQALTPQEQATLRLMDHRWSRRDRERLLAIAFEKLLDSLDSLLTPAGRQALDVRRPGVRP